MGRIKTKMVKNTAKVLMSREHNFANNFEHNKGLLGNLMPSRKIRNKIAGYLARLVKQKSINKPIKEDPVLKESQ